MHSIIKYYNTIRDVASALGGKAVLLRGGIQITTPEYGLLIPADKIIDDIISDKDGSEAMLLVIETMENVKVSYLANLV